MRIEVVVIDYKTPEDLVRCLAALKATTEGLPLDMQVIDNSVKNENLHVIWNRLLAGSNSELFLNISPDVVPQGTWLLHLLQVLEDHPEVVAVGPSTDRTYNEQGNRESKVVEKALGSWVPGVLPSGFCCLYRTKALKILGGWREDFRFYGGDLDMVYRMRLAGGETAWSVPAFVWHEWGGAARALGAEAYRELRRVGNEELNRTLQSYHLPDGRPRFGLWRHLGRGKIKFQEGGLFDGKAKEGAPAHAGQSEAHAGGGREP